MSDFFGNGNGNDNVDTSKRHYKAKAVYRGKVTKQELSTGFNDTLQLILTVALEGEMMDRWDASSSVLPCVKANVPVRITFPADDPQKLEWAAKDLSALGFKAPLEHLDPTHKKHFSFIGKEVHVAPTYKQKDEEEVCYWNLRTLKPREVKGATAAEIKKSGASAAFERAMKALESGPAPQEEAPF